MSVFFYSPWVLIILAKECHVYGESPCRETFWVHAFFTLSFQPSEFRQFIVLSCFSCVWLFCDPMDCVACQASLSMGFSRQEYWSGLPCPPPDLPEPSIKTTSLICPELSYLTLAPSEMSLDNWFKLCFVFKWD